MPSTIRRISCILARQCIESQLNSLLGHCSVAHSAVQLNAQCNLALFHVQTLAPVSKLICDVSVKGIWTDWQQPPHPPFPECTASGWASHHVLRNACTPSLCPADRSLAWMQMFTPRQKGQLDVYGVWGVWRGQLHSDDSFDFNKAASRIKDSISHLPDAIEQDDALLESVKVSFLNCSTEDMTSCLQTVVAVQI